MTLATQTAWFEALGPREQFWMIDKYCETAGLELDLEDLARQVVENTAGLRRIDMQNEIDWLLWKHRSEPYPEMRDKYLEYALRDKEKAA